MPHRLLMAIALLLAPSQAQDDPASDSRAGSYIDPTGSFSLSLPSGWRQMTPDEAIALRPQMPADIADRVVPGRIDRFGEIGRWLDEGFSGRCLTLTLDQGEPEMSEDTLQTIRDFVALGNASDLRLNIESLRFSSVGEGDYQAIERVLQIQDGRGTEVARALQFLVPTGGNSLWLSFRTTREDFAAAEATFRQCAGTLKLANPPEGRKELSDKLRTPIIIGALVGLGLLILYKLTRS